MQPATEDLCNYLRVFLRFFGDVLLQNLAFLRGDLEHLEARQFMLFEPLLQVLLFGEPFFECAAIVGSQRCDRCRGRTHTSFDGGHGGGFSDCGGDLHLLLFAFLQEPEDRKAQAGQQHSCRNDHRKQNCRVAQRRRQQFQDEVLNHE